MSNVRQIIFYTSFILLVLSAALYITGLPFIPYIYAISGAGVAVHLLSDQYRGDNLRLKRLNVQQTIAAVLLPVSSYFMFKGKNEWFIFLFVSALLILYVLYVHSYEEKKRKDHGAD